MSWTCFVITPTERVRLSLIRTNVTMSHVHTARVVVGESVEPQVPEGWEPAIDFTRSRPASQTDGWPERCELCDYTFTWADRYSRRADRIYHDDQGREFIVDEAPVGAIWWTERNGERIWNVRLPNHYVFRSNEQPSGGGHWTVTGEPPNVTVHPSINDVGTYHGWIRNGVISDDVEGRTYE